MLRVEGVKQRSRLVTITLDGERWQEIHRDLLPDDSLPFEAASVEEAEERMRQTVRRGAFNYLGRLLTDREILSNVLEQRLVQRGMERIEAKAVIDACTERGYVDDRRWVRGYLAGQKRKLKGPAAVSAKLCAKGVPRRLIDEEVASMRSPDDQREAITELLSRRLSGYDREKAYRALVRRGFDIDLIVEGLAHWKRC